MAKTIKQSMKTERGRKIFKRLKISEAMERISKDPDLVVGILCLKPIPGKKLAFVQEISAAIGAKFITMPCGFTEFSTVSLIADELIGERVDLVDADFLPPKSKRRQGSTSKRRRKDKVLSAKESSDRAFATMQTIS